MVGAVDKGLDDDGASVVGTAVTGACVVEAQTTLPGQSQLPVATLKSSPDWHCITTACPWTH